MNTTNNADSQGTGKVFCWMAGILILACLFTGLYSAGMFLIVKEDVQPLATITPAPTATLNLGCEDTYCLDACISRIKDFEIPSLEPYKERIRQQPLGYELARYRLESNGQLKRIVVPTVPDYLKLYQNDTDVHQRIWNYFTAIFPNDASVHVSYMIVYVDMNENAASASIADLDGKWRLYVNLVDFDSPQAVIHILAHEYGHMLTLNRSQIRETFNEYTSYMHRQDFDRMQATCGDKFFTGWECTTSTSYLNQFGSRFWTGEAYEMWVKAFLTQAKGEGAYQKALHDFYQSHSDQFINEYAATSPVEDIAESWEKFVMHPKPSATTIADEKVLFFYGYPELVEIRKEILQGVCKYAAEQK